MLLFVCLCDDGFLCGKLFAWKCLPVRLSQNYYRGYIQQDNADNTSDSRFRSFRECQLQMLRDTLHDVIHMWQCQSAIHNIFRLCCKLFVRQVSLFYDCRRFFSRSVKSQRKKPQPRRRSKKTHKQQPTQHATVQQDHTPTDTSRSSSNPPPQLANVINHQQ